MPGSQADQLAVAIRSPVTSQEYQEDSGVEVCREPEGFPGLVDELEIDHPATLGESPTGRREPAYDPRMVRWKELEDSEPEFAARCRSVFDAGLHKVLATLDASGAPRVSGTEMDFLGGDVWLGSMPDSRKLADLRRDPRLAVHCATIDQALSAGDAKLTGIALPGDLDTWTELTGKKVPPGGAAFFTIDLRSLTLTRVAGDRLVIEHWTPEAGYRKSDRA